MSQETQFHGFSAVLSLEGAPAPHGRVEWDEEPGEGRDLSHSHPRIPCFPGNVALTLLPLAPGVPGIPCRIRRKKKGGFALGMLRALLPQHSQRIKSQIPHPSLPKGTGNLHKSTSFPGDPDAPVGPGDPLRPLLPHSPWKTKPSERRTRRGWERSRFP